MPRRKVLMIENPLREGDKVVDLTALREGWEDVRGTVIEVAGIWARVRYKSRRVRSKLITNLRFDKPARKKK